MKCTLCKQNKAEYKREMFGTIEVLCANCVETMYLNWQAREIASYDKSRYGQNIESHPGNRDL